MNENKDIRLPESLKESSKISDSDLEILREEVERDRLNKDLAKNATKQPINILGINKLALSDEVAPVMDNDAGARHRIITGESNMNPITIHRIVTSESNMNWLGVIINAFQAAFWSSRVYIHIH